MSYPEIFQDVPGRTDLIEHDIEVVSDRAVKQYPYRLNLAKREIVRTEAKYMLEHDMIEPSNSDWSSPVVLIPQNRKKVMQFLGLAGFYRQFVANFSEITAPLTNLLKKNTIFI